MTNNEQDNRQEDEQKNEEEMEQKENVKEDTDSEKEEEFKELEEIELGADRNRNLWADYGHIPITFGAAITTLIFFGVVSIALWQIDEAYLAVHSLLAGDGAVHVNDDQLNSLERQVDIAHGAERLSIALGIVFLMFQPLVVLSHFVNSKYRAELSPSIRAERGEYRVVNSEEYNFDDYQNFGEDNVLAEPSSSVNTKASTKGRNALIATGGALLGVEGFALISTGIFVSNALNLSNAQEQITDFQGSMVSHDQLSTINDNLEWVLLKQCLGMGGMAVSLVLTIAAMLLSRTAAARSVENESEREYANERKGWCNIL